MSKRALLFGGAFALALFLFGCGGNGSSGSGTTATTTTTTTGSATTGPKKESISAVTYGQPFYADNAGDVVGNSSAITNALEFFGGSGFYQPPGGSVTALKGLDGTATNAHVQAINNNGLIVGNSPINGNRQAVAWVNLTPKALPQATAFNYTSSIATSVNDSGQIVGFGATTSTGVPQVESLTEANTATSGTFNLSFNGQTTKTALPYNATAAQVAAALAGLSTLSAGEITVSGGPLPGTAVKITFNVPGSQLTIQPGQFTGSADVTATITTQGVSASNVQIGLYWASTSSKPLAIGPANFTPLHINNSGEIVGVAPVSSSQAQLVNYYKVSASAPTVTTAISSLGSTCGYAISLNNKGQIAAATGTYGGTATFLDATGQTTTITAGTPVSINTQGDVAGIAEAQNGSQTPFIWNPTSKKLTNPNTYLPKGSPWVITNPLMLNDGGVMIGLGKENGTYNDFVMQLPTGSF